MPKRVEHPIILGIVGDSASGKTTLSAGVAQNLGEDRCTVLCTCLLYTSPSPRDKRQSRMPSSA